MRPGAGDVPVRATFPEDELQELKALTYAMAESFGLGRRIEAYQGKRPIQLYRWDLDCLVDVVDPAIREAEKRPGRRRTRRPDLVALGSLRERLHRLREQAYRDLDPERRG